MKREDFTFKYDAYGYMLYFHDKPIGGAGTLERNRKHWKHIRADLKMNRENAEREIDHLLNGSGQKRFLDVIEKIEV